MPTPKSLAEAKEEEVVAVWQGLGYYSRARNLQAGVRELVENYGSQLPKERKELETLRGIGPYTAGALLSIVHDLPEAAMSLLPLRPRFVRLWLMRSINLGLGIK